MYDYSAISAVLDIRGGWPSVSHIFRARNHRYIVTTLVWYLDQRFSL